MPVRQQSSKRNERLFVAERRRRHLRRNLQVIHGDAHEEKPVPPRIARQLRHQLRGVLRAEGLLERLALRLAALEKDQVAGELLGALLVSDHQVVHERPGLRVEDTLARLFVVFGRCVVDCEEPVERQQLVVPEPPHVAFDRAADLGLVVGRAKRAVEIRHSLLEPERLRRQVGVEELMQELVVHARPRVDVPRGLDRDEVSFVRRPVDPGDRPRLALVERHVGLEGRFIPKHEDRRRHRRVDLELRPQARQGGAQTLELEADVFGLALAAIAVDREVRGVDPDPGVLLRREGSCRRARGRAEEPEPQGDARAQPTGIRTSAAPYGPIENVRTRKVAICSRGTASSGQ